MSDTHVRTKAREAVVALLVGADIADVGAKVHSGRVHPFGDGQLPAIAVYCRSETIRASSGRGDAIRRERGIVVVVEIYATANQDLDDVLDTIALAVERALIPDRHLSSLAKNFEPAGTEIGIVEAAQRKTGVARLNFQALIHTLDGALDQPAD